MLLKPFFIFTKYLSAVHESQFCSYYFVVELGKYTFTNQTQPFSTFLKLVFRKTLQYFYYMFSFFGTKTKDTRHQIWRIRRMVIICNFFFRQNEANGQSIMGWSIVIVKEPIVSAKISMNSIALSAGLSNNIGSLFVPI